MSRFNKRKELKTEINLAGGESVSVTDPRLKLYELVATNLITNKFYESSSDNLVRLREVIAQCPPMFVAQLAVYARSNLNLRTAPLVLMVELAKIHRGDDIVSRGTFHSIQRADELAEVLGYYQHINGSVKKISKQLQKGIAQAFGKFDEYQFSKYKGSGKDITLRDAMFLTHPKPLTAERADLYARIASNSLVLAGTWESKKSAMGQEVSNKSEKEKVAADKEVWEQMIDSRKMGYMAILRNLRNIIKAGVSQEHLVKVASFLTNEKAVANSKQLPFRFYTAYKEINELADMESRFSSRAALFSMHGPRVIRVAIADEVDPVDARIILEAVKKAGIMSLSNLEIFSPTDRVVSVLDVSGSMSYAPISEKSTIFPIEVGAFYSSMMAHLNSGCRMAYFGTKFGWEERRDVNPFSLPTESGDLAKKHGHGTSAHRVFERLLKDNVRVDKLILWTDVQFYDRADSATFRKGWHEYRSKFPECKLIIIDLLGYGKGNPVESDGQTFIVNGFSSETFKTLSNLTNTNVILKEIESVRI